MPVEAGFSWRRGSAQLRHGHELCGQVRGRRLVDILDELTNEAGGRFNRIVEPQRSEEPHRRPVRVTLSVDALDVGYKPVRHLRNIAGISVRHPLVAQVRQGVRVPARMKIERRVRLELVLAIRLARCRRQHLGDGEVVASGPARAVLTGSLFAPQMARVVPGYLTVEELDAAWERT